MTAHLAVAYFPVKIEKKKVSQNLILLGMVLLIYYLLKGLWFSNNSGLQKLYLFRQFHFGSHSDRGEEFNVYV